MSGDLWTSANDDASIAKANRKQILIADGLTIENTVPEGLGQLACCTDTLANGRREQNHYYCAVEVGGNDPKMWGRLADNVLFPINWGYFVPVSSTFSTCVDGMLKAASSSGTVALQSMDTNHGRFVRFTTSTSGGATGGFNMGFHWTQRQFDPAIHMKFRLQETTANRYYAGFTGPNGTLTGDDPLNANNGFILGKRNLDTDWHFLRNDSTGATVSYNTGVGVSTTTTIMHLYAFDGMGGFAGFVETSGGAEHGQSFTTDVPCQGCDEDFQAMVTNVTGGNTRRLDVFQALITSQR